MTPAFDAPPWIKIVLAIVGVPVLALMGVIAVSDWYHERPLHFGYLFVFFACFIWPMTRLWFQWFHSGHRQKA